MSEPVTASPKPGSSVPIPCLVSISRDIAIDSIHWSPDGARIALGDAASKVEVLTAEGRTLWEQTERERRIWGVRWAPDGHQLASVSLTGAVRLWDPATGQSRLLVEPSGASSRSLSWSPAGDRLVWTSNRELRVATADTGRLLFSCEHSGRVNDVAWSPDGLRLASCSSDRKLWLWDGASGEPLGSWDHESFVLSLHWSPDGRFLASGTWDGVLRVWNVAESQLMLTRAFQGEVLRALSWSARGDWIAAGAEKGRVLIVDAEDGSESASLTGPPGFIWSVAFSPDSSRLAAAGYGFRIWDLSALRPKRDSHASESVSAYVARQAATVGRRSVGRVRELWVPNLPEASGACLGVLRVTTDESTVSAVDIFPDGYTLATGHSDGAVRRWDLRSGKPIWAMDERRGSHVRDVKVSPRGDMIASGSSDNTLKIWAAETGGSLRTLTGSDTCARVEWSPAGDRVAGGFWDKALWIWDCTSGELMARCVGHSGAVLGVSWSPDGRLLASASTDNTIRIWDAQTGVFIHAIDAHSNDIWDVKWSPDGHLLASISNDGTVAIWVAGTWDLRLRYQGHQQGNNLNCLAWSPDGSLIASAGYDQIVRVWEVAAGRDVAELAFEETNAWRLAWAPDGAFLVSSHQDDVFRFWDTRHHVAAAQETMVPAAGPTPRELALLPEALAGLHRLGLYPPLSLLKSLLDRTGGTSGNDSLAALDHHPGLRALASLRWPAAARVGLAALLLRGVPLQGWQPPSGASAGKVAEALEWALRGETVQPQAPPPPAAALQQAADLVDDPLLTLLSALGPDAVAADPGLPLRLLPRLPAMPALSAARRQMLGIRLRSGSASRSLGYGSGSERSGVELRGDLRSLLPSQLVLPPEVLTSRHLRGELLYRARTGEEAPRLRPAVLVLDISPASFGPVEGTTRLAAHVLASSLLQAGLPVVLVTAGGRSEVYPLERPSDLVEVWTRRSLEPAEVGRSLGVARALRETLREGPLEPAVVLLAHAYFGAEDEIPAIPGLRALFVQYPAQQIRPPLAGACERWESLAAGETSDLIERLAKVAG